MSEHLIWRLRNNDTAKHLCGLAADEIVRLRAALIAIQKIAAVEDKGSWSDISKFDLAQDMDSIERVIDDALVPDKAGEQGISLHSEMEP